MQLITYILVRSVYFSKVWNTFWKNAIHELFWKYQLYVSYAFLQIDKFYNTYKNIF